MHRNQLVGTVVALTVLSGGALGCDCAGEETAAEPDASGEATEFGLTEAQAAQVLAKVGDTTITVGEFAERLADQSPYLRARYNSPERRREFLDNMIRFELLALEADERGYDELPEVERTRNQVMVQQMMKELFEDEIELSDITDEEIREYYEAHRDEFHKPEQVRASHIVSKNEAEARKVLAELEENPRDINLFRELAEEHNQDSDTEDRYGDLGFFARPGEGEAEESADVPAPVAEAAFQIERIGGVHPDLVRTDDGYHVVKLTGRRAALRRSLDEARRPIQNRLWRQKREKSVEDFVAELRKKAAVKEEMDLLDQIRIDVPTDTSLEGQGETEEE